MFSSLIQVLREEAGAIEAAGKVGGRGIEAGESAVSANESGDRNPVQEIGGGVEFVGTAGLAGEHELELPVGQSLGRGKRGLAGSVSDMVEPAGVLHQTE